MTQLPGRAAQTRRLIGLGPSNKGVSKVGSLTDRLPARAPGENDWGPLHPGIDYTMVMTRYDEVASPYTNGYLPARANVTNILFQDVCEKSQVGHLGLPYDRAVGEVVSSRLDGRVPVAAELSCSPSYPL